MSQTSKTVLLNKKFLIKIFKKKGVKSIRLTLSQNGDIRLTTPKWVSNRLALEFLENQLDFIKDNYHEKLPFEDNQLIGRYHRILVEPIDSSSPLKLKVTSNNLIVSLPPDYLINDPEVQTKINLKALKILKDEAENYLPQRLSQLATLIDYEYQSVKIKQLKRRWGRCDNKKNITFNFFLINLPNELVDYVIYHELCHTKVLNHSVNFWQLLESIYPGSQKYRKMIKKFQPQI